MIVTVIVVAVLWGWLRAFAWFDPVAFCRIHIDVELLEGERGPIREAITLVRREDPLAYRALCRWVDRIQEERQCDAGDPQADPRLRGRRLSPRGGRPRADPRAGRPRLLRRGSRVIVLRRPPDEGGGPALVRARAEALKRLAGYSQSFWLERVR